MNVCRQFYAMHPIEIFQSDQGGGPTDIAIQTASVPKHTSFAQNILISNCGNE